jgi:serine/threonine protein kinase
MLIFDPSNRITASEALLHPYFSEYGLTRNNSTGNNLTTTISTDMPDQTVNLVSSPNRNRAEADSSSVNSPNSRSSLIH